MWVILQMYTNFLGISLFMFTIIYWLILFAGGERVALKYLGRRIKYERDSFLGGSFLPNRREPDILNPPKSLSPDLKFGCISVKRFYWDVMDAWNEVHENDPPGIK